MTPKLVAVEGDTHTQDCRHHCALCPCTGDGDFVIPSTLQDFVFINDKLVILDGQPYSTQCDSEHSCDCHCVASSTTLFINGLAVVRSGDFVDSPHKTYGVNTIQQSFIYSD